jgi:hypothetical protein
MISNFAKLFTINMPHILEAHWDTPRKARLQAAAKDARAGLLRTPGGSRMTLRALFRKENVP